MRELRPEWLIVGSSPSAPKWLEAVQLDNPTTIATNRAYSICPDPDIYFLGGEILGDLTGELLEGYRVHYPAAKEMQAKGTHLVSLKREPETIKAAGFDFMDEYLMVDIGRWGRWRFLPGHYTACWFSGLFCLQYAVNHGAESIHCVGMEGYAASGPHYFDDGDHSMVDPAEAEDTVQAFTQAVITACPDIAFHFYGQLNYSLQGENLTIHEGLPCDSNSPTVGEASGPETSETCQTGPQMC